MNEITYEYVEQSSEVIRITNENFLEKFDELLAIIMNSPEFLGLADRTQLIFDKKENREGKGSVYNRQTHTAYVASISLDIAKKKEFSLTQVEQKIVELIAWCHDLGHTAFGHTGENRTNKILSYYNISAEEFSDYYMGKFHEPRSRYNEVDHSFEHHAHSTRVLRKILSDNNIIIEDELLDKIEWGIMCHSESRVKKAQIQKPLWTIARYADKFYAFTDIMDIIKSGTRIPNDVLVTIKNDEFAMAKCFGEQRITQEDIDNFSSTLDYFYKEDAFKLFKEQYVNEAQLDTEEINGKKAYFIKTDDNIGRLMRILQGVAKYMRKEGIIGKEEILADAMVDEIVAYRIAHPSKNGLDEKAKVIEACLFITSNTDTELRRYYEYMAKDAKWCKEFDEKLSHPEYDGFEIKILQEDRNEIRKNPDIILNYDFDVEVEKVENSQVKMQLYRKIKEYRGKPLMPERRKMDSYERRDISLAERRELIHLIETAKSGGNPFFKRNIGDRGECR